MHFQGDRSTMKAMVLNKLGSIADNRHPLEMANMPDPVLQDHEILISVSTCGVCHTELDEIEGRTPPPQLPIILGHQVVGRVDKSGSAAAKFRKGDWSLKRGLVVNHMANATWVVSTIIGGFSGQFIPERALGIDYALIAMFICLLVFQLKGRKYIVTAIIAGISAVFFSLVIPGNAYIILASIVAATLGVIFKKNRPGFTRMDTE